MIINNFISVLQLVEDIARDTEYELTSLDDAYEWSFKCIRAINAPVSFVTKGYIAAPEDYRLKLPDDFQKMLGIRDYNNKKPLIPATNIYYKTDTDAEVVTYPLEVNTDTTLPTATFYIDGNGNPILPEGYLFPTMVSQSYSSLINPTINNPNSNDYTYKIEKGWLFTSLTAVYLEMVYEAFPLDEYGFPLIPDDESFINAVKSYIIERLDYRLWRKGKITDKVYAKSEQERAWYMAQAANKSKMPMSADEYEALRRQAQKIISHPNQHDAGFRHLNRGEKLNFNRNKYSGFSW